jgi:hypothetical protein
MNLKFAILLIAKYQQLTVCHFKGKNWPYFCDKYKFSLGSSEAPGANVIKNFTAVS